MNEKKKGFLDKITDKLVYHAYSKTGFVETHMPNLLKRVTDGIYNAAYGSFGDKKK
jgi:hypothetical protein